MIDDLFRILAIAAECVAEDPELLPIFERMERELEAAERHKDALERARRIARERGAADVTLPRRSERRAFGSAAFMCQWW